MWLNAVVALLLCGGPAVNGGEKGGSVEPRLVEVQRIWNEGAHNAFTDLIRHEGTFFCVFREGKGHVSPDGAVRVLRSEDGKQWRSAARVTHPEGDLRDPKISRTPEGKLMLLAALAVKKEGKMTHRNFVWFSEDGEEWGEPLETGEENIWLWRTAWRGENCYGLGYSTDGGQFVRLYKGDGREFEVLVPDLFSKTRQGKGYPNETALVFAPDGTAYCLLRRDADSATGQLGIARPPYTEWQWKDSGVRIGGPEMVQLPDGRLLAVVRFYDGGARTSLAWVDRETGDITESVKLPSGGDTSYAGMVLEGETLWVSYYSSHEGRTSIYCAEVALEGRNGP